MKKTLLILGEHGKDDLNKNIKRLQRYSQEIGLPTSTMSYEQLFEGESRRIKSDYLKIMFFFPFEFWNKNCEITGENVLYGTSNEHYKKFENFWQEVKEKIEDTFSDKFISYIIHPDYAAVDRDKLKTHDLLEISGVLTTTVLPKNLEHILEIAKQKGVFIKSRYGALGKGITYLSPRGWFTNYKVVGKNNLKNHSLSEADVFEGQESLWRFQEITGNKNLVKRILDSEMIVEEEISSPEVKKNKKFDIRVYSVFGGVPYLFFKENDSKNIVTNFCQGGKKGLGYGFLIPLNAMNLVKEESIKASKVLNAEFLGVDIVFDKNLNSPRVLEVQTFAGYPKIRSFNLSKYLAEKIKNEEKSVDSK